MTVLPLLAGALVMGGLAYLILAIHHTLRRPTIAVTTAIRRPPVTVMIPAHGAAPRLAECLRSVCSLDYPGLQVVFGLHTADDPARPEIERVRREFPTLDTALVIDGRRLGANPKNTNLANMLAVVKHDILVMVDSDVLVSPGFLDAMVQPLADPQVGGVTCLYSGAPEPGLASHLGALYHNDWFVPSVLVDLARRDMDILYGAAIAVSRRALDAIGGFAPMADAVAQDFVLGHRLHRHGFHLRLANCMVATVVAEPSLRALMRHEMRWSRAVRAVRPLDHVLSIFMSPLALTAPLLAISWPPLPALALVASLLGLRWWLHHLLRARFPLPAPEPWLLPLREMLNAVVWARALMGRKVRWGETELIAGGGLSMTEAGASPSQPQPKPHSTSSL